MTRTHGIHLDLVDGRPVATSLNIAEVFGKRHDRVLRAIENMEIPANFRRPNFGEASYVDAQGKSRRMFTMTRDGFTLLAMGFTGKAAMQFKIAYIEAFNRMEAELAKANGYHQPMEQIEFAKSDYPVMLKRFLAAFDDQGRLMFRELDPDTYLLRLKDLPRLLADSDAFLLERRELFAEIAKVAASRAVFGATSTRELFRKNR